MATYFKNKVVREVGLTPSTIVSTNGTTRLTIIGLSLANLTDEQITASITVTDDTGTTGYYAKDIEIPPQTSLRAVNGGEKLIIAPSNSLEISANQEYAIDVIASYVEIV